MKTMQKWLALVLALALLLTFTACGKEDDKKKGSTKTTAPKTTQGGTATTLPTEGGTTDPSTTTTDGGLLPDDERNGSKELPFEIGGVLEFDAVVQAGGVTYYDVYRVDGTDLRIESKDAYVEYEGKTYEPKNGVITFPVTTDDILNPVKLAIGNKGTADATFKVTFTYPKGTLPNPYELGTLKDGDGKELKVQIEAGNETGVVYTHTATANGVLHIDVIHDTDVLLVDVEVYNLTSGVSRTMGEDGEKGGLEVPVAKGDEVRITYMVLPNEKNEYPAMTIESTVSFSEKKEVTVDGPDRTVDYTVTVKDQDGKPVAGVELRAQVELIWKTVTTDSNGVAKFVLPEGDIGILLTIPKGYIAESKRFWYPVGTTDITITLEKEQPVVPPDPPADPEVTTMDYTVTLQDGNGAPMGGLTVLFYNGDKQVAKQVGDKKGVSKVTLDRGTYTVKVEGTKFFYDEKAAVVSVNKSAVTLTLAAEIDTSKTLKINDPLIDKIIKVPYLSEGAAYVPLVAGERNYFLFEPTRDGTYRFSSSNTYAKIGYYGGSDFVMSFNLAADTTSGNAFNISVNETQIGNVFVIGIDAATNCDAAVLQVTRIGDPAWSIEDEPTVDYTGNGAPKPVTAPSGLTNLDIFSSTGHELVYNEKDGYYHLDSSTGPVVYVQMDNQYASIQGLLTEFGNMTAYLYNADGTFKSKEQYALLMQQYVNNMDKTQKVYPLTRDLKYMLDNYGNSQNWWNEGEPGYLFEEVEGVNPANAWMFLYCYKK